MDGITGTEIHMDDISSTMTHGETDHHWHAEVHGSSGDHGHLHCGGGSVAYHGDVVDIGISGDGCVHHPSGGGYSASGSGSFNIGAHF